MNVLVIERMKRNMKHKDHIVAVRSVIEKEQEMLWTIFH